MAVLLAFVGLVCVVCGCCGRCGICGCFDDEVDENKKPENVPKARCKHPKSNEKGPLNQIQRESPFNEIFYIPNR